jgi:hypothetical protein
MADIETNTVQKISYQQFIVDEDTKKKIRQRLDDFYHDTRDSIWYHESISITVAKICDDIEHGDNNEKRQA